MALPRWAITKHLKHYGFMLGLWARALGIKGYVPNGTFDGPLGRHNLLTAAKPEVGAEGKRAILGSVIDALLESPKGMQR